MDPSGNDDAASSYFGPNAQADGPSHLRNPETPPEPLTEHPPPATTPPPPGPTHPRNDLAHVRTASQLRSLDRQQSAIRLRRLRGPLPSRLDFAVLATPQEDAGTAGSVPQGNAVDQHNAATSGRRRSSSEPQRPFLPQGAEVTGTLKSLPPLPESKGASAVAPAPAPNADVAGPGSGPQNVIVTAADPRRTFRVSRGGPSALGEPRA